jgi:hypothetical protein
MVGIPNGRNFPLLFLTDVTQHDFFFNLPIGIFTG